MRSFLLMRSSPLWAHKLWRDYLPWWIVCLLGASLMMGLSPWWDYLVGGIIFFMGLCPWCDYATWLHYLTWWNYFLGWIISIDGLSPSLRSFSMMVLSPWWGSPMMWSSPFMRLSPMIGIISWWVLCSVMGLYWWWDYVMGLSPLNGIVKNSDVSYVCGSRVPLSKNPSRRTRMQEDFGIDCTTEETTCPRSEDPYLPDQTASVCLSVPLMTPVPPASPTPVWQFGGAK